MNDVQTSAEPEPVAPLQNNSDFQRIPMAVLGNSDSHAYQDKILLRSGQRGGPEFRPYSYQWTEVINVLRNNEIDLGPWGAWGEGKYVAGMKRLLGLTYRMPRKEDFEYNFAISGATCKSLTSWLSNQLAPLTSLLQSDPDYWSKGVLVIRIGINDLGTPQEIRRIAQLGLDAQTKEILAQCDLHISHTVAAIRALNNEVRIALIGLFEEPDAEPNAEYSASEILNIRTVIDKFDENLEEIAQSDQRITYIEDRSWWKSAWGTRDASGRMQIAEVRLLGPSAVTNSKGDHPTNALLNDGHAGTVVNGFFARHLLNALNAHFGYAFTPLEIGEIASIVDPEGAFGLAPPR